MGLDNLKLKNISARDRAMIADIEKMLGPEPSEMGFAKNLFWGRFREDVVLPYPQVSKDEKTKCDALIAELEAYMKAEHPAMMIDEEQYIPDWVVSRLFDMGVMGMTVPEEYGGLGLGITSYNRVLETIGRNCASTAVMVSAHQSIGCKAIMLFGTEEQKKKYLPIVARQKLSAFCLSEPNVGSDAAGQETRAVKSKDGKYFILNGEKKWSTSGSIAGVLTVMAKQMVPDPRTGKDVEKVTALIMSPDQKGVEIFEGNRSKVSIRGTWQARIRFTNVKVPVENVLHKEGKGLNVALTCLNFGRCTLSAGITGAAKRTMDQAVKWVQTRYQFSRPVADFELVQERIARMAAYTYAMDAVLYMMTGMLDRGDQDIMVETAMTKVFCSQFGWEVIDDAMQIMGGEAFMTENEVERTWRDNRIHRVVEGSNEVMQPFIFAYGGKQLAEQMLGINEALGWEADDAPVANVARIVGNMANLKLLRRAVPLALQLFLGLRPAAPVIDRIHPLLGDHADRLSRLVREHSHYFKMASKWYREDIITRQSVQARLADNAIYLFVLAASMSKMDNMLREGMSGVLFERDRAAFEHAFDLFELKMAQNVAALTANADSSMKRAAEATRRHNDTLPNSDFYIHEGSPVAKGTGLPIRRDVVKQFPGTSAASGDGHVGKAPKPRRKSGASR